MTEPAPGVVNFTAILDMRAIIARPSIDPEVDPWEQAVSGLATFVPTIRTARSVLLTRILFLEPITGKIDDGVLTDAKRSALDTGIAEEPPGEQPDHRRYGLRLTASCPALGLPPDAHLDYRIVFSRVVFNRREQKLEPFTFAAPEDDQVLDLSLVVHRSTKVAATR